MTEERGCDEPGGPLRWGAVAVGLALLLVFFRLVGHYHLGSRAGLDQSAFLTRELPFWLAHIFFVVPASLFLARGFAGPLLGWLARQRPLPEPIPRRTWMTMALALAAVVFCLARVLRATVLLDLPITDDDNSMLFGARCIAAGHLWAPLPPLVEAFGMRFMYRVGDHLTSGDFPGGIFFRALALVTRLDAGLYALWATVTALAVAVAGGRLAGRRGAWWAAALWLVSPHTLWLSATTQAQVASRGFIALAVMVYAGLATVAPSLWRRRDGAALGLLAGLAFFCRPAEATTLLLPLIVHLLLRARGARAGGRSLLFVFLLAAIPIAAFALYNQATTGTFYLPARLGPGAMNFHPPEDSSPWRRLATNLGFNLTMLAVFFLGPLGFVVVAAGRHAQRAVVRALAVGVGLQLALALAHDDTGLHTVGPIHYADTAVPLILLAALGILVLLDRLTPDSPARRGLALGLGAYLAIALPVFNLVQGASLQAQAGNQAAPLRAIEQAKLHHAVVLSPPLVRYWLDPQRAQDGSWVYEYPPPDPFLRDEVLVLSHASEPDKIQQHFPGRRLYEMRFPQGNSSAFAIVPVARPDFSRSPARQ